MLESSILNYNDTNYSCGTVIQKYVSLSEVSSLVELVANVAASTQVQILSISLATDTAAVFTIKSGSDIVQVISLSAYNTFSIHSCQRIGPLLAGNIGGNISITPSVEINVGGIYIQYVLLSR
jgi:hypothetical protein